MSTYGVILRLLVNTAIRIAAEPRRLRSWSRLEVGVAVNQNCKKIFYNFYISRELQIRLFFFFHLYT